MQYFLKLKFQNFKYFSKFKFRDIFEKFSNCCLSGRNQYFSEQLIQYKKNLEKKVLTFTQMPNNQILTFLIFSINYYYY